MDHHVAQGTGHLIELGPLTDEETQLLARENAPELDDDLAVRLVEESEGNPFLTLHLLELIDPATRQLPAAPTMQSEMAEARLRGVSELGRQLLTAASIIGRSFDPFDVQAASGRSDEETALALDELIARGLERETQRQQPGLVMEAAPSGRGLALGGMSSASMAHNPFGDRSLSQRFHHASIDQDPSRKLNASMPGIIAINTTMNTNYELGTAYLEMGLHREALDEFEQAMDDPDVTAQATFSMALCYYHLDQRDQTRDLLQRLLHDPHTSPEVRQRAQQLATRL